MDLTHEVTESRMQRMDAPSRARLAAMVGALALATVVAPALPPAMGTLPAQDTTAAKGKKEKGAKEGTAKRPKEDKPPQSAADSLERRRAKVEKDSLEAERRALFATNDQLQFTLIANFGAIGKDRDSTSKVRYPGTLVVKDSAGAERRIPVALRTRGHFRLKRSTCRFVNLLVLFPGKKGDTDGTPFEGQKSLKLGGHCQDDERYEQLLRREYLAYRIFNTVSPRSFRARLATGTYLDSVSGKSLGTRTAMFIENEDDMAARQGGRIREFRRAIFADMDGETLDQLSIFQFLIGNTDFSIYALHNVRLAVTQSGRVLPIPYDFDFSGLVSAPYASPPPQLSIRSVRDRLYRGPCRPWADVAPSVGRFTAKQGEILALVEQVPGLVPNEARDVKEFLQGFFAVAGNAREAQDAFVVRCVNKPGV